MNMWNSSNYKRSIYRNFVFPGTAELFAFLSGRRAYDPLAVGKGDFRDEREKLGVLVEDDMEHPDRSIWIHQLQNIQRLNLSETGLLELPEEIGNLTSLKCLQLEFSRIQSLPASIGKLQNLRHLGLGFSSDLYSLPKEIGDLASLEYLCLSKSAITSLPSSIGRLQNLRYLCLSFTSDLYSLPKEIGDLASLETLRLSESAIASLPSSIGRLQNLRYLYLDGTKNLLQLPQEIGNLSNLVMLEFTTAWGFRWGDSNEFHIPALPISILNLKRLQYLGLGARVYEQPEKSVLELIEYCRSLCSFGRPDDLPGIDDTKIGRALGLNRARLKMSRTLTDFGNAKEQCCTRMASKLWPHILTEFGNAKEQCCTRMTSKLWPHILENAINAFHWRVPIGFELEQFRSAITKADAVYQLLCVVGREAFVGALLHDRKEEVKEAPDMDGVFSGNKIRKQLAGQKRKREGDFISTHT